MTNAWVRAPRARAIGGRCKALPNAQGFFEGSWHASCSSTVHMGLERRRASRVECIERNARLRSTEVWRPVELADTSLTGARLRGKQLPALGTVIELELVVPCQRIHLRATVAWFDDTAIGVQFDPLPKHRQVLVNNAIVESYVGRPGRGRVLLLIDDPEIQSSFARAIVARGYDVISRSTPLDALQALEAATVILAIVSSSLPNRGGLDLLDYLAEEHPAIERVVVDDLRAGDLFDRLDGLPAGVVV